jgi:hypothetical protein
MASNRLNASAFSRLDESEFELLPRDQHRLSERSAASDRAARVWTARSTQRVHGLRLHRVTLMPGVADLNGIGAIDAQVRRAASVVCALRAC